ncbi:MAG: hypothetical protein LZF60_380061 [Nitrospira sp.]|nr:MAG: hypothetical protein LZF60_380061 [Nitrospira sp.]
MLREREDCKSYRMEAQTSARASYHSELTGDASNSRLDTKLFLCQQKGGSLAASPW